MLIFMIFLKEIDMEKEKGEEEKTPFQPRRMF